VKVARETIEHGFDADWPDRNSFTRPEELQILCVHPQGITVPRHVNVAVRLRPGARPVDEIQRLVAGEVRPPYFQVSHVEISTEDDRAGIIVSPVDEV
jgi:hypothetical protein